MAENEPTKVCPFCAETIKAAAKVCPYCRSQQVRYALWRQELTLGVPALILIVVVIGMIAWNAPDEKGVGGRSFAGHQNDLVVKNTSLGRDPTKPDFWLSGVITNRSEFPWRVHRLEVRFLDERGALLDVRHPNVNDLFVVLPGQEHGFRADLGDLAFTNSDVTRQVFVRIATDGNRLWRPD